MGAGVDGPSAAKAQASNAQHAEEIVSGIAGFFKSAIKTVGHLAYETVDAYAKAETQRQKDCKKGDAGRPCSNMLSRQ